MDKEKLKTFFSKWRNVLLVWAAFVLFLGLIACIVLYRFAVVFEKTAPERVMDTYVSVLTPETLMSDLSYDALPISAFDDASVLYGEYFAPVFGKTGDFTYSSYGKADKQSRNYLVCYDKVPVCEVTLAADMESSAGFGRHFWNIAQVRAADFTGSLDCVEVDVIAPDGFRVFANGVSIPEKRKGESCVPESVSGTAADLDYVRYTLGRLYGNIDITGEDGTELPYTFDEAAGKCVYTYRFSPDSLREITVRAPGNVKVSVDGTPIRAEQVSTEHCIFDGYEKYTDSDKTWNTVSYRLKNYYGEPEITAVSSDGRPVRVEKNDAGNIQVYYENDEALQAEVGEYVQAFIDSYFEYSASGSPVKRRALSKLILMKSELYNYIHGSYQAMIWASRTDVTFNDIEIANFASAGDNAFTCTVSYNIDAKATNWTETYDYNLSNKYEMLFVKDRTKWLAAEMRAID